MNKLIYKTCLLILINLLMPTEIYSFSEPVVRKAAQAQQELINIGRVVSTLSLLIIIILFIIGKPQWKWFIYVFVGAVLLSGFGHVSAWLMEGLG